MIECCKGLAPEPECACAQSRIAELEAENQLLIDAVNQLRQELSRIADAAADAKRMPIRDLREKLHSN